MKIRLINGWTKEKVLAQIKKYNNGTRAVASDGVMCLYNAPDGNRCFAGCFIPDGHKAMSSEGSISDVLFENKDLVKLMPFNDYHMRVFQRVHDTTLESGDSLALFSSISDTHERAVKFLEEMVE